MRIGQTSIILFVSKIIGSLLGFVGTVYFANALGSEVIGVYVSIIAVITWLQIPASVGGRKAIKKRLSEQQNEREYFAAGIFYISILLAVTICAILLLKPWFESYFSDFDMYSDISVVWFIITILTFRMSFSVLANVLHGQDLVHIAGVIKPARTGIRTLAQYLLIISGLSVSGLLLGHAIGAAVAAMISITIVSIYIRWPKVEYIIDIYHYAKFSWLRGVENRTFSNADIVILGIFVPTNLVGIYSVAWSVSSFLNLFNGSVSAAVFPTISNISAQDGIKQVSEVIEDAIAHAGLIIIPGVIGGSLLANRLFTLYGDDFQQGPEVLWMLLITMFFYTYLNQFSSALNALDRPDLVFKVNILFIFVNIACNFILIKDMGWIGAAVASVISAVTGAILSYYYLYMTAQVAIPIREISKQISAAACMGAVVFFLKSIFNSYGYSGMDHITTVILTGVGAISYFSFMTLISENFRDVVIRNIDWKYITQYFNLFGIKD